MNLFKKSLLINFGLIFLLVIFSALFDYNLKLGDFHGLVFKLWSLYGIILLFVINIIIAVIFYFKNKKNKAQNIFFASLLVSVIVILLLMIDWQFILMSLIHFFNLPSLAI